MSELTIIRASDRFLIEDFSGGLNLRDAASEVAQNESPDLMNITLDERGGIAKRLGLLKLNGASLLTNPGQNLFYWRSGDKLIVQDDDELRASTDGGATWDAAFHTFTTNARCGMCEFGALFVFIHPVDGLYTWTGGGAATLRSATVKGSFVEPWQNKVWAGGDTSNRSRLYRCAAGDPTTWTPDFVDLRDKDDTILTAAIGAQGMDAQGRAGLIVFKEESAYRVYSASDGAYTTLDRKAGAAGSLAVAAVPGRVMFVNRNGMYVTDGVSEPTLVSPKIKPVFKPTQLNYAQLAKIACGVVGDRFLVSLPWGISATANTRTFEYHPREGWITCHDFGAGAFAVYSKNTDKLLSTEADSGKVFETFKGGSDDGAAIVARYQTRWFTPGERMQARITRLRVFGRGQDLTLHVKKDWRTGTGLLRDIEFPQEGFVWGVDNWGVGVWGPSSYEQICDLLEIGVARSFSFEFRHSGTTSESAPKLLDDGASPEVGAFAVYSLVGDFIRLGAT